MKVCIVCYGLNEYNIRLQPWRYIFEIASGISKKGINVVVVTDGSSERQNLNDIKIRYIKRLRKLPFQSNEELIFLIKSEKPDIILWSVTALDYLYLKLFKQVNIPIIGMFTGPIYRFSDLRRIGANEILNNAKLLSAHILYASLPSFFIHDLVNSPYCSKTFVMSRKNKEIIVEMGGYENKVVHIPVGVDEFDFKSFEEYDSIINKYGLDKDSFNVLYFGSPITIRGIDSLIKAISKVKIDYPYVKLLILSRRRDNELSHEEMEIHDLIQKLDVEKNVQIISGFLSKDEVKKFLCFSDLVTLPFKIVPSDMPTSILESMVMGKTVISTSIDGIPELLENGRGLVVKPNEEEDLVDKILFSIQNQDLTKSIGKKAALYMQTYPKWSDVSEFVVYEITEILDKNTINEVAL